jgi:hypothetical protein
VAPKRTDRNTGPKKPTATGSLELLSDEGTQKQGKSGAFARTLKLSSWRSAMEKKFSMEIAWIMLNICSFYVKSQFKTQNNRILKTSMQKKRLPPSQALDWQHASFAFRGL